MSSSLVGSRPQLEGRRGRSLRAAGVGDAPASLAGERAAARMVSRVPPMSGFEVGREPSFTEVVPRRVRDEWPTRMRERGREAASERSPARIGGVARWRRIPIPPR